MSTKIKIQQNNLPEKRSDIDSVPKAKECESLCSNNYSLTNKNINKNHDQTFDNQHNNNDIDNVDNDNQDIVEAEDGNHKDYKDLTNLDKQSLKRKRKKGIIYISNIPKYMNVTRIREILGEYGEINRVYLQPEKLPRSKDKGKKKKQRASFARHFSEGWVEFQSKRTAKQIANFLNNKQISTRKKSQFFDCLWSMKYLPRFKWYHLTERMNYEQAVHKQRLMAEVSQARKETTFFQNNLDKSDLIKKKEKKLMKLHTKQKDSTDNTISTETND